MFDNMVSQQFKASTQGELGTISRKIDPSVQMTISGPVFHSLPVAKMQINPIAPFIGISTSELVSSPNMDVRSSNLISSYQEPPSQPLLFEQQEHNVMVQSSFVPRDPVAGYGSFPTKLDRAQLPSKRKSPMEFMPNGGNAKLLAMPNKRMVFIEHQPWLQGTSELNRRHVLTSSVSPRTQYLPALSKRTVQLESVSGNKLGKQTAPRKQNTKQPPLKPQNEFSESLRCKMREALTGALALVKSDAATKHKSIQSRTATTLGKSYVGSQSGDPTSAAYGVNAILSNDSTPTRALDTGVSAQKVGSKETVLPDTSTLDKSSDAKDSAEGLQFANPFPQDNVSYSDNVFLKNDLLQGNDLSWVLDSDVEFRENSQTVKSEALAAENGNQRIKEKSLLDPQLLAFEIEAELYKLFGGVNKKYKEKGRSLLFNLKDKSNPELRQKVMHGEIPAERLCTMSAEQLASKELAEWRQAKAEELAQMVVLPDTQVDIRSLVRKTHKGEFQVEVETMDSGSVEVSVGSSSLTWSRFKNSQKKSASMTKKRNSSAPTNSSNESSSPTKGITVDDEMRDATGSLPPIVSLDEYTVSLDSDLPSDSLSSDAGKEASESDKNGAETSLVSISPIQSPNGLVGISSINTGNVDTGSLKPSSNVTSVIIPAGERIWEGSIQLGVSSVTSVVSIFRSGEKTSGKEWPQLLEIKGRVRLEAFEKFLRELPNSRSRAVMVLCFVCKEECPKTERDNLSEVVDSYIADDRVGLAEPATGVELYLCPTRGRATEILSKIVTRNQLDFLKSLDQGLIGVVVWRRPQLEQPSSLLIPSPSSSSYSHKNQLEKGGSTVNMNHYANKFQENHSNHDDEDCDGDVPPGFGPRAVSSATAQDIGIDEDDLPEFNYGSNEHVVTQTVMQTHSQSLHQVRELINKYGKSKPLWNQNIHDDENDIPEWQPQLDLNPNQLPLAILHESNGRFNEDSTVRSDGRWWAHQS